MSIKGQSGNRSHGMSHQGIVNARSDSSSDDDNEDDDGSIPNWIEFRERIRKELKEMNSNELWEILHILISEMNSRWNLLVIDNRMRNKK